MAKSVDIDHDGTPLLTSKRIYLRGWEDGDFAHYLDLVSDSERMQYVGAGAMTTVQAQTEYRQMCEQWITRGIGIFVIASIISIIVNFCNSCTGALQKFRKLAET